MKLFQRKCKKKSSWYNLVLLGYSYILQELNIDPASPQANYVDDLGKDFLWMLCQKEMKYEFKMCLEKGCRPSKMKKDYTLAHHLAFVCEYELLSILLDFDQSFVKKRTLVHGYNPLYYAAYAKHQAAVLLLLAFGSDRVVDNKGRTVKSLWMYEGSKEDSNFIEWALNWFREDVNYGVHGFHDALKSLYR